MLDLAPPTDAVSVIAQEFLVDRPCAIAVDVPGAHVQMRPGPENDRVEVEISVSGCPAEEAEDILNRMDVGTRQMKDTVRVHTGEEASDAEWWRWIRALDVTVHVELRLPSRIEAELRVPGGQIDIADLEGHIDLQVMGGPCHASNLGGTLDIQAESSEVTVDGFSGEQLRTRVAVGSLTVTDVQADTIALHSVSSPITLTNAEGAADITANGTPVEIDGLEGPCTARCQGGTLSYSGAPSADTELTVVGSTLDVRLPSGHAADLTMTGDTLSLSGGLSFDGDRTEHEIDGTVNGGGPPLILQATGGQVQCRAA